MSTRRTMNGTRRVCQFATVIVLVLAAASRVATAESFVCNPITRGDTATGLALRLTGNMAIAYTDWFQIRNPERRQFVPKSQYERLSTAWQVCVAPEVLSSRRASHSPRRLPAHLASAEIASANLPPANLPSPNLASADLASTNSASANSARANSSSADSASANLAAAIMASGHLVPANAMFALQVGLAVSIMLFACSLISRHLAAQRMPPDLQRAGEQFVYAFARPLVDPSSLTAPVAAQLRFVARREQLEVLIAPVGGRRYPNLRDHKNNVEYDVTRVVQHLGSHLVVGDRLREEGTWVVIPIRRAHSKQAGRQ